MNSTRAAGAMIAAALAATTLAACTPAETAPGEEVVLTCAVCTANPSSTFDTYRNELALRFNEAFEGRYRIEFQPNINHTSDEGIQTMSRLALADELPDLFIFGNNHLEEFRESATVVDFAEYLERDAEFADGFQDGMLGNQADGSQLFIPEQRDLAGVFYNTALLDEAGVDGIPETWGEFEDALETLAAAGTIPLAMDGDWVTKLWLTHIMGTQPGGAEYLASQEYRDGGLVDEPIWIDSVEILRDLHVDGFVNEDAFSGDFQRAGVPYLQGEAATLVNGPWQVPLLSGEEAIDGLADVTVYAPAPGDGVIVITGNGGWASGAKTQEERDGVWEFIKFANSWDEQFNRTVATGSYSPIKGEFSDEQLAQLDPINGALFAAVTEDTSTYPILQLILPTEFANAWANYWPAYVQGQQTTSEFLELLDASLRD